MDFLLECIGFPPTFDLARLVPLLQEEGEPVAWRGDPELHRKLALGGGLELRMDREPDQDAWTFLPHYLSPHRQRVAVMSLQSVPDSPFDALVQCWAEPPIEPESDRARPGAYRLALWLTDRRRLPRRMDPGQVLAVAMAGFALDVSYVGPNSGVREPRILDLPSGASIEPLGGTEDPGGCAEVSLRVRALRHLRNPITGEKVELVELDAPGRPVQLFLSHWQLERDGMPTPRPGWRVEGTFLFLGRIVGGLPRRRVPARVFG